MAFQQTLRRVQAARATTTTFGCLAVILFSFVIKLRRQSRDAFLKQLTEEHGDLFEIADPTHTAYGGLALIGLAVSIAWNGFSFIDLCIKKHYRFDRRVCIFVDIVIAVILLVTGFLTFMYDAVLFIALEIASSTQVKLEVAATGLLAISCLCHVAFFCYGCKDPNVAALSFEHVPMQIAPARMGGDDDDSSGDYHEVPPTTRSRANTNDDLKDPDLVEIDLGKKVHMIKLQPPPDFKDPLVQEGQHTPPKTPSDESKRFGLVGLPARLTPTTEQANPFLRSQKVNDWI